MTDSSNYTPVRALLIIGWGATLVAIHWQNTAVYVIPFLAFLTFLVLPLFPTILSALILSGYLDLLPIQDGLKFVLIGVTWLAVFSALGIRWWRVSGQTARNPEIPDSGVELKPPRSMSDAIQPGASASDVLSLTPNFRHDLQTPVKLIVGFCQSLLTPTSAYRQPLPALYREDVEAIYRNARQIESLHEKLFAQPGSLPSATQPKPETPVQPKTLLLLDSSGAVREIFNHYLSQHHVIHLTDVAAIGRLKEDSQPTAVLINSDDAALVPLTVQLVGKNVPVLTFRLGIQPSPDKSKVAIEYLAKPIEYDALAATLNRISPAPREVLIVDDNRDHVQLLSRMLASLPQPPRVLKAYSGREALALLNETNPDVIFLDFVLPDMDGLILLNYLRADSRLTHIPVALISAHRPPDVLPIPTLTKLTLYRLSGFSPAQLAQSVEALLTRNQPLDMAHRADAV